MAHFTRVRASFAAWATGAVTQTEFDKFDSNLFAAINGDAGGTWAPSSAVVIGGSGLEVSGQFLSSGPCDFTHDTEFHNNVTFDDDVDIQPGAALTVHGDATIGTDAGDDIDIKGTLTVHEDMSVQGESTFQDDVFIQTGSFTAHGDVTLGNDSSDDCDVWADAVFHNTLNVDDVFAANDLFLANGQATFNDDATFNEPVVFQDNVDFNDPVDFNDSVTFDDDATFNANVSLGSGSADDIDVGGTMTLHHPLGVTFHGRVPQRAVVGPDGGATYKVTDCNTIFVPALTSSIAYSIDDTDAVDGDFFEITLQIFPSSNVLTIQLQGGGSFGTLKVTTGQAFMKLVRIGGSWQRTVYRTD